MYKLMTKLNNNVQELNVGDRVEVDITTTKMNRETSKPVKVTLEGNIVNIRRTGNTRKTDGKVIGFVDYEVEFDNGERWWSRYPRKLSTGG